MFHRVINHGKYKITLLLTHPRNSKISYNDNIEIITELNINNNSKQLTILKNKLYTKHKKIIESNNVLLAIKIEANKQNVIKTSLLYRILKKHIPTIFNASFIKEKNILHLLQNDFTVIYQSACIILGEDEVQKYCLHEKLKKETVDSFEQSFDLISSCDAFSSS